MPITLNGSNGITFPTWTTATRPTSPSAGQTGFNTTTSQMETYDGTAWEINTAASTQGTSGQYLKSNGSGAAPSWATLTSSGALIRAPQVYTSGTSYTTPATCNNILVELIGGGGGGGSANQGYNPANASARGGGGGNSVYGAKYVAVTPSTTYTIAIGAAGTGGASGSNNGTAGGTTSITIGATTYSVSGGGGGSFGLNTAGGTTQGAVGSSGTGTNTDYTISGTAASAFFGGSCKTPYSENVGGNIIYYASLTDGNRGIGYGAGGGGGFIGSYSPITYGGGNGQAGIIRIWEYT